MFDEKEHSVIGYYHRRESDWGYRLLLRGCRHFGYYPAGRRFLSMAGAQRLMEDRLGTALALPPGSLVLDAGCGEGWVARRLSRRFGLRVEGVDLLAVSIDRARRRVADPAVGFQVGSYARLPFADGTFAGLYTMETLVHAADHREALAEFHRVLVPGGRLVLVEYSMPAPDAMTAAQRAVFEAVNRGSGMHSFPEFTHGRFPAMLAEAGFACDQASDVMPHIVPMLRRLHHLGYLPYAVARSLGRGHRLVNAMAGVELYRLRDLIKYNIVVGHKPARLHLPGPLGPSPLGR